MRAKRGTYVFLGPLLHSVYNSRMNQAPTDAPLRRTFRGSRDALIQKTIDEPELGSRVLITLNAFRLLITTALLLLFVVDSEPHFFGEAKPTLFAASAAGYLVFAILSAISLRQKWVPSNVLATTQLIVDIIAIVLLMHASGVRNLTSTRIRAKEASVVMRTGTALLISP